MYNHRKLIEQYGRSNKKIKKEQIMRILYISITSNEGLQTTGMMRLMITYRPSNNQACRGTLLFWGDTKTNIEVIACSLMLLLSCRDNSLHLPVQYRPRYSYVLFKSPIHGCVKLKRFSKQKQNWKLVLSFEFWLCLAILQFSLVNHTTKNLQQNWKGNKTIHNSLLLLLFC